MKKWLILLLCLLPVLALAEEARIIDREEKADYTVLLTEEKDGRYITIRTEDGNRRSGPWPGNTIFYGVWGDGMIELLWDERVAWYGLCPDGAWRLTALHDAGVSFWVVAAPWGMYEPDGGRLIVGNFDADLFTGPVGDGLYDMVASPDRTGWAVVKVESAPLYATPAQGESCGTFFAGTPARVLDIQGDWVRLSVAADASLTGWMQADQLAVGPDVAGVEQADIRFSLPESEWDNLPDTPPYNAIGVQGPFLLLLTEEGVKYALYDSLAGAAAPVLEWERANVQGAESLFALAEGGDSRRLWVCETDEQGWTNIRHTRPLPWDVKLTVHRPEEWVPQEITLSWQNGQLRACFNRRPDGEWLLCGLGGNTSWTAVYFCGTADWMGGPPQPSSFGGLAEALFSADLETIFERLDRRHYNGWALVESFFAEVYDGKNGEYICRLWQGTPLRILREEDAWCQVELGDGGLTGWVLKGRLALRDDIHGAKLLPDLACTEREQIVGAPSIPLDVTTYDDMIWPVGETADGSQAILLLWDGAVGYCPSGCILPENG